MGRVQRFVALLFAIVSLSLLPACSARIPGPVYADGNGPLFANGGSRVTPGSSADPFHRKISLAPGDVLYTTVIYAGFQGEENENFYLPFQFSERLPLRFVGSDSRLTDGERQFLFMTLSAARGPAATDIINRYEPRCRELLGKWLNHHEKTLWNLFVASLSVQRTAAEGTGSTPSLEVKLATEELEAKLRSSLTELNLEDASANCPTKRFLFDRDEIPISAIGETARSISLSVFQFNGKGGRAVPTDLLSNFPFARTAVSQIEFGGASANELHGIERHWSLADWAQSGICQVDGKRYGASHDVPAAVIRAIVLRTGGWFSPTWLRIKPEEQAQLNVSVNAVGSNRIERILKGDRKLPWGTLSESSLKSLTMADVMAIDWEVGGKPASLNNCKGR